MMTDPEWTKRRAELLGGDSCKSTQDASILMIEAMGQVRPGEPVPAPAYDLLQRVNSYLRNN